MIKTYTNYNIIIAIIVASTIYIVFVKFNKAFPIIKEYIKSL